MSTPETAHTRLLALYETVDRKVAAAGPRCELSGRCCDFPRSGHTLFATRFEADLALAGTTPPPPERDGWCPFYRRGLCTLRDRRPLGCRLYFCDPRYRDVEMPRLAEWAQGRLRRLHEDLDLPYRYGPFLAFLPADPRAARGSRP